MSYARLSEILGMEHVEIEEDDTRYELFEGYIPWGGGGAGSKNGHYGCKHTDEAKRIMREKKLGYTPWNKGVTGYLSHTDEAKKSMSDKLSGSQNGRAILVEDTVRSIIETYLSRPNLPNVGTVQKNGVAMSYDWAFCKHFANNYGMTPEALNRLLKKKTWKNVWSEYSV